MPRLRFQPRISNMTHPALFLSHGAPTMVIEDTPVSRFIKGLGATLDRPKAIVVASPHWATRGIGVGIAERPGTIHDFFGFDPALYKINYPAPGAPAIADRVAGLLEKAGFAVGRVPQGMDHGMWAPLSLIYPDADIPVVPLSIDPQQSPAWFARVGAALAPLRDEVLIVGSGNLTHNLRAFRMGGQGTPAWVSEFAEWMARALEAGDVAAVLDYDRQAPHARENHPTNEHLLPLFLAMGAGGAPAKRIHASVAHGALAMDAYRFG